MAEDMQASVPQTPSDEELALAVQQGDDDAFGLIFERYFALVRHRAKAYFLAGGERQDLVQEGIIGLYKAARDYRPDRGATFATFANLCITRQMLSTIKRATRRKHAPLNSYVSLNRPAYGEDGDGTELGEIMTGNDPQPANPEEIFLQRELLATLRKEVPLLLSNLELTVLLAYLQGASYRDIALRLGRSEKTVDNAIQRTKKKMETYFKDLRN